MLGYISMSAACDGRWTEWTVTRDHIWWFPSKPLRYCVTYVTRRFFIAGKFTVTPVG